MVQANNFGTPGLGAVFASRRGQLPSVRALIDHLAERFQALDED